MTLGRGQTALGAFYRRLAGRIGKPQAITATARKLAILVYRALKGELVYRDPGADAYDLQQRTRVLRRLRQTAPRSASTSSIARPARSSMPRPRNSSSFLGDQNKVPTSGGAAQPRVSEERTA